MTSPVTADHEGNTLLGYCFLYGDRPFMKENIPSATQVGVMSGARDALRLSEYRQDFRFIRGYYGFLATLIEPLLGVIGAMLAINWLAWALAAWIAWRLTLALSGSDLAALFAVLLVAGGIGMTLHIGDYSPHLLAHATYYLGIWLLYSSGVYRERRPWIVHARLSALLAIACLVYNSGIMLICVYVLTAARRNRWTHVIAAAAFALAARPLWQLVLGPSVVDVEAQYLTDAIHWWTSIFREFPFYGARMAVQKLTEFLFFFDSPLVVLAAIASFFLVPLDRSQRWFGACAVLVPLGGSYVFSAVATARGYLIYGITVWGYACLAWQLARILHCGSRRKRLAMSAATVLLLGTHLFWSTAHLWHDLGPAKTYFLGWDNGWPCVVLPRARVVSLTGREPTPILFGGQASLAAAGAHVAAGEHRLQASQVSFWFAVAARGWFFGYTGLLAVLLAGTPRRRLLAAGLAVGLLLGTSAFSWATFRSLPAFFHVDEAVVVPPQGTLHYRIALSTKTAALLRQRADEGDRLVFFLRGQGLESARISFIAGRSIWDAPRSKDWVLFTLDGPRLTPALSSLGRVREIVVELANESGERIVLSGWQRGGLPGRECTILGVQGERLPAPPTLPALEIRLLDEYGRIKVAGF